jgi:hypothetical protein
VAVRGTGGNRSPKERESGKRAYIGPSRSRRSPDHREPEPREFDPEPAGRGEGDPLAVNRVAGPQIPAPRVRPVTVSRVGTDRSGPKRAVFELSA